jgi:SAM-dependent methyltransferase
MTTPDNRDEIDFWRGEAGRKWAAEQARLDAINAEALCALLKVAALQRGERALDIGCGCGTSTFAFADAVGPEGEAVGVDVSTPMLSVASQRRRELGLGNVEFVEADAAEADFGEARFDLAASRFGVMFFADPKKAFQNIRRFLKSSGRLAFVCWRSVEENEWVRVTTEAVRPHVPPPPPFDPEAPGPFSFADPKRVRDILANSGFRTIEIAPHDGVAVFGADLDEGIEFLSAFGPASRLLAPANERERAKARGALRDALKPYAAGGPVRLRYAQWLVAAQAA